MSLSPWNLWIVDVSIDIVGGILFMLIFLFRHKSRQTHVIKRDITSWFGIGLELIGCIIIVTWLRFDGTSFSFIGVTGEIIFTLTAVVVITASIIITNSALRALGQQWSLGAQLLEGHELITNGVYGVVRHPIYTGMFGMFLGCALAITSWWGMLVGGTLFIAGTVLRIRSEEKLLTIKYGNAYREYARRIPALIPRPHRV
jgi:protein-S-isoprenylcysteine O-methyltransferase Ste14